MKLFLITLFALLTEASFAEDYSINVINNVHELNNKTVLVFQKPVGNNSDLLSLAWMTSPISNGNHDTINFNWNVDYSIQAYSDQHKKIEEHKINPGQVFIYENGSFHLNPSNTSAHKSIEIDNHSKQNIELVLLESGKPVFEYKNLSEGEKANFEVKPKSM